MLLWKHVKYRKWKWINCRKGNVGARGEKSGSLASRMPSAPLQPFPWPPARTRLACRLFLPSAISSSGHPDPVFSLSYRFRGFYRWWAILGTSTSILGTPLPSMPSAPSPAPHDCAQCVLSLAIKHSLTQIYSPAEYWFKLFKYTRRKPGMKDLQIGLVV